MRPGRGALPAPASAAPALRVPESQTEPPRGYRLSADEVKRIAARAPRMRAERPRHRRFEPTAYTRGPGRWQVSFFAASGDEVAQVRVDDATGAVLEQWTGDQVAWTMARGYEGAFGRKLNSPWVWIPLCLLFLAPFIDPRRPLRMLHLDLLVLLGFGISHVFFNRGEIDMSVPLVYPVLVYLLARLLWVGLRPRAGRPARWCRWCPSPGWPWGWLCLVGFRVGLNVLDSNVIDVGYAGVIGADRIADGDPLYGAGFHDDVERGDTYGPLAYLSYVPFEQALPWSGAWDEPAGRARRRARVRPAHPGRPASCWAGGCARAPRAASSGLALGWAWASYPYALFALQTNSNDSLVGLATVLAMLGLTLAPGPARPVGRRARGGDRPRRGGQVRAAGAGAAVRHRRPRGRAAGGGPLVFAVALALVLVAAFAPFVPDGGLREIYDRTVGYQAGPRLAVQRSGASSTPRTGRCTWCRRRRVVLALAVALVPARTRRRSRWPRWARRC